MGTDPIADFLTRIRNALHARKERVDIPWSRLKEAILKVIAEEGFIKEYSGVEEQRRPWLRVWLKYDAGGRPVTRGLTRATKPSLRTYVGAAEIPVVQHGLGVSVLSTERGTTVDRGARRQQFGGQ